MNETRKEAMELASKLLESGTVRFCADDLLKLTIAIDSHTTELVNRACHGVQRLGAVLNVYPECAADAALAELGESRKKFEDLKRHAIELQWMARRYADGRMTGAVSRCNQATRFLLSLGVALNSATDGTVWARDGSGSRACDGLTEEEAAMGNPKDALRFRDEEVAELRQRLEKAESALTRKGYRKECSIPACNCGDNWSHGGLAEERLREISDEVWENGVPTLDSVRRLKERAEKAEKEQNELQTILEYARELAGVHKTESLSLAILDITKKRDRLQAENTRLRTQRDKLLGACRSVIQSCVHPETAVRAVMVDLTS